jgi:Mn2+/Fe2+ NRAMP family transporter
MRLSADKKLMGPLVSGRWLLGIGWLGTALLVVLSLTLVATSVFGIGA